VRKVVGGGSSTFFWTDNWVGGVPLRDRFPRLFSLAEDRWATVAEMESRGWTERWRWGVGVEAVPLCLGGGECGGVCCYFA